MNREEIKLIDISGVLDLVFEAVIRAKDYADDIDDGRAEDTVSELIAVQQSLTQIIEGEYTNADLTKEQIKEGFRHKEAEEDMKNHEERQMEIEYREKFGSAGDISMDRFTFEKLKGKSGNKIF